MNDVEQFLQKLLDMTKAIPEKDGAGVFIPAGIDASIKAKAIQDCLRIIKKANENENF